MAQDGFHMELDMRRDPERVFDELALAGLINRNVAYYQRDLILPALFRIRNMPLPWNM
jgi:hypothetical protein